MATENLDEKLVQLFVPMVLVKAPMLKMAARLRVMEMINRQLIEAMEQGERELAISFSGDKGDAALLEAVLVQAGYTVEVREEGRLGDFHIFIK